MIVKALGESTDAAQRGRLAATGLTEADYGLPDAQTRALKAISGGSVDATQCGRILAQALEGSAAAVDKRCGSWDALKKNVANAKSKSFGGGHAARVGVVVDACKVTEVSDADASLVDPWAVVLSAVVADELAANPPSSDDEKAVAKALRTLCNP